MNRPGSGNGKDRVVKCKTCMGMLVVKNSMNEVPICYGLTSEKDLKMSNLQEGANKMHAYQYEKSDEKKLTSVYFGNSFWTGLVKRTPQGEKRTIVVHPTFAFVVRMHREVLAPATSAPNALLAPQQQQPMSLADQLTKGLSNSTDASSILLASAAQVLERNANACREALTPEKYGAFCAKFSASASSLGSNLTTNFVPRFTEAGTNVVGACIKVGYSTYDTVCSILTK